ncbi:MAG: tRNA (adenosine(37)-N6)-threonylcarbamoyltransferase complex dimerization subunit type 1 TsaB [Firmicutes bacterium]|nr:tRNA (adenosine(37)-N6)-threonylcarbamoyltransferase complex dimerization subunit type 1 TsaB [Bacillota bacterium]
MKTLFIDTHLFNIDIILFDDYNVIAEAHVVDEKHNSKFLVPALKKVCDNHSYDQIIVVNGPGSFTGVRLGVTIAKTLAFTQNIPIKSISSLDLMYYSNDSKAGIYAIGDGNGSFIGEYNNERLIKNYYYLSNQEYQHFINNQAVTTSVTLNYECVLKKINNVPYELPHNINPLYVKLIGVESDKKS